MDLSGIEEFAKAREAIPKFAHKYWALIWQIVTIGLFAIVTTSLILYI